MKKTIKAICALGLIATLGGCAAAQRAQQQEHAKERTVAARAEMGACLDRRKAGEFSYVQSATCVNDAQRRGFVDTRYQYMDLMSSVAAARLRIAEQLDMRQISEPEATARLADKMAEVQNEERRRNEDAAIRNAAIRATDAAATASYMGMIQTGVSMMTGGR